MKINLSTGTPLSSNVENDTLPPKSRIETKFTEYFATTNSLLCIGKCALFMKGIKVQIYLVFDESGRQYKYVN